MFHSPRRWSNPGYFCLPCSFRHLVYPRSQISSFDSLLTHPSSPASRNEKLLKDPVRLRQISERIPAGRWGEPKDFAGPVVFLASPASQYVCGELLVVDGVRPFYFFITSPFGENKLFTAIFFLLSRVGWGGDCSALDTLGNLAVAHWCCYSCRTNLIVYFGHRSQGIWSD
jgi:hypothetical protein